MSKTGQPSATSMILAHFVTSEGPAHTDVAVYQQGGVAVVREDRTLADVHEGHNEIILQGMPTQCIPNTLTVLDCKSSAAAAGSLKVGSISYRAANLDKARILQSSIGKKVTIKEVLSHGKVRYTSGKLAAVLGTDVAVEQSERLGKVMLVSADQVELDEGIPRGLSATPSLTMSAKSSKRSSYAVRMLYETGGLGWQARHSAFFDEKTSMLTAFETSVTIDNRSGATFRHADVKLIAGANSTRGKGAFRLQAHGAGMESASPPGMMMAADAAGGGAESVGETQAYSLNEPCTINDGQMQVMTLLAAKQVPVEREYFLGLGHYFAQPADNVQKLPVGVRLRLINDADSKLGTALPAGEVCIYQSDSKGVERKVGSARVDHVAVGEKFKLEFGPCMGIKAQRQLIESKDEEVKAEAGPEGRLATTMSGTHAPESKWFREEERELVVFNYKDEAVEVVVSDVIPEKAEWLKKPSRHKFAADGSGAAAVTVKVAAGSETKVRYRIRWQQR